MESKIRVATKTDLPACHRLFEIGKTDHSDAYAGVHPAILDANLENGHVLVAEVDGEVAGMISAVPVPSANKTMLYMLVVDRMYRGQKLAPELIRHARSCHDKAIAIIVPHALKSFEMAGMTQTGMVME